MVLFSHFVRKIAGMTGTITLTACKTPKVTRMVTDEPGTEFYNSRTLNSVKAVVEQS